MLLIVYQKLWMSTSFILAAFVAFTRSSFIYQIKKLSQREKFCLFVLFLKAVKNQFVGRKHGVDKNLRKLCVNILTCSKIHILVITLMRGKTKWTFYAFVNIENLPLMSLTQKLEFCQFSPDIVCIVGIALQRELGHVSEQLKVLVCTFCEYINWCG